MRAAVEHSSEAVAEKGGGVSSVSIDGAALCVKTHKLGTSNLLHIYTSIYWSKLCFQGSSLKC